jgi:ATP-dependent Clp protease ATP-binding subunit ClpB
MATVRDSFKPEFLNRLDEIIVFHRLEREDLARIVEIQLAYLKERLETRSVHLEMSPEATRWIADKGYDAAYGARPLKRLIQRSIENELALKLLDGTFHPGDTIVVGVDDDALTFERR